jgi:hypothetical protein
MDPSESTARNSFSMRIGVASLGKLPEAAQLDLALGRLDDSVLTTPLLHEIMHHNCANSAVNLAMQHRWLALLRLILSSPNFPTFILEEYCELAAGIAAIEAVLQPIAEGLAVFAEFDCAIPAATDRSPSYGFSDRILLRLLRLKRTKASAGGLVDRFQAEQLDAKTIKRKADILCFPANPATGNEIYFIAYLLIRSFWNRCANSGLRPAHLLDFLYYYFYGDWVLARILLLDMGSVELAVERIQKRCANLLAADIPSMVRAFLDDKSRRENGPGLARLGEEEAKRPFEGLGLSSEEIKSSILALARFLYTRIGPDAPLADDAPIVQNLIHLSPARLIEPLSPAWRKATPLHTYHSTLRVLDLILEIPRRKIPFCYLTETKVGYARQGSDLLMWVAGGEQSPRALPLTPPDGAHIPERPSLGCVVSVMSSREPTWPLLCFLFERDELKMSWVHSDELTPETRKVRDEIIQVIRTERQMEEELEVSFAALNGYLRSNPEGNAIVKAKVDAASRTAAGAIRGLLERAGWAGLFSQVGKYGLGNTLPEGAVHTIAALGMCKAFAASPADLAALMDRAGHSLEDAFDIAAAAKAKIGVSLIETVDGDIYPRI